MHREEADDVAVCSVCALPIAEGVESAYYYSEIGCLCSACAIRRGGAFDAQQERWTTPPSLDGLTITGSD